MDRVWLPIIECSKWSLNLTEQLICLAMFQLFSALMVISLFASFETFSHRVLEEQAEQRLQMMTVLLMLLSSVCSLIQVLAAPPVINIREHNMWNVCYKDPDHFSLWKTKKRQGVPWKGQSPRQALIYTYTIHNSFTSLWF